AQAPQVHHHARPSIFGGNGPPLTSQHSYRSNTQRPVKVAQICHQRWMLPFGFFHGRNRPFFTRTLPTHFFLRGPFPMKDCSTLPSSCSTKRKSLCTYNIPYLSGSSLVAKYATTPRYLL